MFTIRLLHFQIMNKFSLIPNFLQKLGLRREFGGGRENARFARGKAMRRVAPDRGGRLSAPGFGMVESHKNPAQNAAKSRIFHAEIPPLDNSGAK